MRMDDLKCCGNCNNYDMEETLCVLTNQYYNPDQRCSTNDDWEYDSQKREDRKKLWNI